MADTEQTDDKNKLWVLTAIDISRNNDSES